MYSLNGPLFTGCVSKMDYLTAIRQARQLSKPVIHKIPLKEICLYSRQFLVSVQVAPKKQFRLPDENEYLTHRQ
jgi:hypothetical protein